MREISRKLLGEMQSSLADAVQLYNEDHAQYVGEVLAELGNIVCHFDYGIDRMVVLTDAELVSLIFSAVKDRPLGKWNEEKYRMMTGLLLDFLLDEVREETASIPI